MNQISTKNNTFPMYFGDFGGILIPDSFISDILEYTEETEALLDTAQYQQIFSEMIKSVPDPQIRTHREQGQTVYLVQSQVLLYMVSGYLAIAKLRKTEENHIGVDNREIALFAAEEASRIEVPLNITLGRQLSGDMELRCKLQDMDIQVDAETCSKLYNRPQAYAFQKYLGNRRHNSFIPVGQNLGPYPFPALSGLFSEQWGKRLYDSLPESVDACAVTMSHGNAAIGAFRAFKDVKKITVERPICQEYHGEFCGCSLLMTRPSEDFEYSITICPELADWWRMAEVIRLGAGDYSKTAEMDGIKPLSARAIEIIRKRIPNIQKLLIVEGEDE